MAVFIAELITPQSVATTTDPKTTRQAPPGVMTTADLAGLRTRPRAVARVMTVTNTVMTTSPTTMPLRLSDGSCGVVVYGDCTQLGYHCAGRPDRVLTDGSGIPVRADEAAPARFSGYKSGLKRDRLWPGTETDTPWEEWGVLGLPLGRGKIPLRCIGGVVYSSNGMPTRPCFFGF